MEELKKNVTTELSLTEGPLKKLIFIISASNTTNIPESILQKIRNLEIGSSSNFTLPSGMPSNLPKLMAPGGLLFELEEHVPEFNSNSYNFTMILRDDGIPAGSVIGFIYVKDADFVDKDKLTLNFTQEQDVFGLVPALQSPDIRYSMFKLINSKGKLTQNNQSIHHFVAQVKLNFFYLNFKDMDRQTSFPSVFVLDLLVTDLSGNTNSANVYVQVIKMNAPFKLPDIEWDRSEPIVEKDTENQLKAPLIKYKLRVNGTSTAGQVLHTLKAMTTDNNRLKYKLVSESDLFHVDEMTGQIATTQAFEDSSRSGREKRTLLFVQAYYDSPHDRDVPVWSHVALVEINLVSWEVPVFVQPDGGKKSVNIVVGRNGVESPMFRFEVENNVDNDVVSFRLVVDISFSLYSSYCISNFIFYLQKPKQNDISCWLTTHN